MWTLASLQWTSSSSLARNPTLHAFSRFDSVGTRKLVSNPLSIFSLFFQHDVVALDLVAVFICKFFHKECINLRQTVHRSIRWMVGIFEARPPLQLGPMLYAIVEAPIFASKFLISKSDAIITNDSIHKGSDVCASLLHPLKTCYLSARG